MAEGKTKTDTEALAYTWDWAAKYLGTATITGATVSQPAGITVSSPPTVNAGKVTVLISGGTLGQSYDITCTVVLSTGETAVWTLELDIRSK